MVNVEWSDGLSVGVELIDEQHKMLISRIDNLANALAEHKDATETMKVLDFLVEYADFHFKTEEKHMQEFNYPGYEKHKIEHEKFVSSVALLSEDLMEEGVTRALSTAVNMFLTNWLFMHIQQIDGAFGVFLKENNYEMKGEIEVGQ